MFFRAEIINSVPFSKYSRYSLSSIRVPSESKNRWNLSVSIISLARLKKWSMFFTAREFFQYDFHYNNSTKNTEKQWVSEAKNMFPSSLFWAIFTSKYLLSDIILRSSRTFFSFNRFQKQSLISFQKQPHVLLKNIEMFLEAATHQKNSCTFSFRSSRTLISFRSSRTFLKKHRIFSEAATHSLKSMGSIQKQLHGLCTKYTHFVWRFFITFQCLWKHLWRMVKNPTALYECH